MKRYDLAEENGSFVLLELRPVPVATFAERGLAELVRDLLEEAGDDEIAEDPRAQEARTAAMMRQLAAGAVVVRNPAPVAAPPSMAEAVVIVPAEEETETGAAPESEAPRGGGGDALPAEALTAHAPSLPADEPPSWEALHARGLTAKQAAETRGAAVSTAYKWAQKAGVEWVSLPEQTPAEPAPRPAADLKGWSQEDLDAALLQVEQGGKVAAVADEFGKPAHVLNSHWMKRLAAKREAAGLPLRTNGATQRDDAEAGR